MPIRTIITLAVAVMLGLVAVLLVRNYLTSTRETAVRSAVATVPVVVASQPIERGKAIEAKQLKVVKYPADAVPAGTFQNVADIAGAPADKRLALRSHAPNEPVLASRVSGPGGRLVLSASLADRMRAVSLKANEVTGVSGFVLPGDRVDILLTREVGGEDSKTKVTQVLAENVRVLGIDQSDNEEATKPDVVNAITIEVTPEQAQAVALAQSIGDVSLSLRQIGDQAPLGRRSTTTADLGFRTGRPALVRTAATGPRRAAAPSGSSVRVTRGVETADYRVP